MDTRQGNRSVYILFIVIVLVFLGFFKFNLPDAVDFLIKGVRDFVAAVKQ